MRFAICTLHLVLLLSATSAASAGERPGTGGAAALPALPEGLLVDEYLFPREGALEANGKLLMALIERGGAPAHVHALYGIHLLAQGDHAGATRHCREALARGKLFEPTYCMSILNFREGKLAEAADFANQAIALRPHAMAPYVVLANIRKKANDRAGMVTALEAARTAIPGRAPFWEWELARLFEELGDLVSALQCAGTLARLTPEDPKVFFQAGDWLRKLSRLPEAATMFRFALSKASWYQAAAVALLETLKAEGQLLDMIRSAEGFLLNPQLADIHATARTMIAEAKSILLDQELAAIARNNRVDFGHLDAFNEIEPGQASSILHEAAQVCLRFGQPERALQMLRKAETVDPANSDVQLAMGLALRTTGQLDLARTYLEQSLQLTAVPEAWLALAQMASDEGMPRTCLEHARELAQRAPDDVRGSLAQAYCHRVLREPEKELGALERAVRVAPEDVELLHQLALHHLHEEGGLPKAKEYLERKLNLAPFDFPTCITLGEVCEQLRLGPQALGVYSKCMAAIPPFKGDLRAEIYGRMTSLLPSNKDTTAIVTALGRACKAGFEKACADLEAYSQAKTQRKPLIATEYKRPRRGDKLIGELERLGAGGDDFIVLGLAAPGFEKLSREEKLFLYFMSRAAIAGDGLLTLQNHRHAPAIVQLMETLFRYRSHLPPAHARGVHEYLKLLWINHGNYDHRSGRKLVPAELTAEALREDMTILADRGETFSFLPGAEVGEKLAYLEQSIFDAGFEPLLTVTDSGVDIVEASAVNHYDPGITSEMIETLAPAVRNALGMRFALRGGQVVPEAYRIGGLGSELIENVVYFLEQALPHAGSGSMKKSIEELIAFYRTGDEQAFRRHSIEWLKTGGNTDYINGFVEQLKDPRGVIGNFEGMAAFVSEAAVVERLASEVAFLEKNLPWPEQFKRQNPAKPVSNVATLLVGTGDMGPVPWAGYNLPNYEDIRSGMGSKNVVFINVMTSRSAQEQEAILKTFYLPEYRNTIQKWGDPTGKWEVVLHEIIGHGSGKADPGLKDDPRNIIGRSFSPLEEARADLVALYYVADKKLIEIGAYSGAGELDQDEIMLAAYVQYFQEFLILHRRFEGGTIKQAHWRGRQAILSYLLNGGDDGKEDFGIALVEEGGHYYVRIASAAKVRNGIAKLLAKIQTIKSMGDKAGAEALIDRLGTSYSQAVFDSVAARASALNLAKQKAFVFPRLQPVLDKKGNILDVKLLNDEDLTSQKLRFSRLAASRAIE